MLTRSDVERMLDEYALGSVAGGDHLARMLLRHKTFIGVETSLRSCSAIDTWRILTGDATEPPTGTSSARVAIASWLQTKADAVSQDVIARDIPDGARLDPHLTYGFLLFGVTGLSGHALLHLNASLPTMGMAGVTHERMAEWRRSQTGPFTPFLPS